MANQNTPVIQQLAGNVGIGTSTPSQKLDVSGGVAVAGNISFDATTGRSISWALNTDSAFIKFISTGNGSGLSYLEIGTTDDGDEPIKFSQSGNIRALIDTDGRFKANVGIDVTGTVTATTFSGAFSGTATSVSQALTFKSDGTGDAATTTYNGGTARAISYNSVGAPSTTGTNASGNWGINITGNSATVTNGVYTIGDQSIAGQKTFTGKIRMQSNMGFDAGQTLYFGYEEGFSGSDTGGADYGYITYDNNSTTYGSGGGETSVLRIGTQNDGAGAVSDAIALEAAAEIYLRPGAWGGGGSIYRGTYASKYKIYDEADATTSNTANKLILRDGSGNFSAGTITATTFSGALSGNATTATTAISATSATTAGTAGYLVGTQTGLSASAAPRTSTSAWSLRLFDNYNYNNNDGSSPNWPSQYGTVMEIYGRSGHEIDQLYFGHNRKIYHRSAFYNENSWTTFYQIYDSSDSATANTGNTLVLRDGSGNFSAGTITATTFSGALSGNATTATDSSTLNGISAVNLYNNMGEGHGTRTSFDATTPSYGFGYRFVQGSTNGPGTGGSQFYSWYIGLGSQYPATGAGSYGAMFAIDRASSTPYLSVRFNEANGFSSWYKIRAGYADSTAAVSGTTSYIPKFTSATAIGNSAIYDNGGNIGIGITNSTVKLAVNTNFSTINGVTISTDDYVNSQLILRKAASKTAYGIMAWESQVYIGAGIYYESGVWVHHNSNNNNQLFVPSPGTGVNWYASNDGAGSWNVASNVTLWNDSGYWKNLVQSTAAGNSYFTGGNVGIGITSPTYKLQVTGSIYSAAGGTDGGQIILVNSGGGSTWYWAARTAGLNLGELTQADGRLFIANGGNVGIGTTTPTVSSGKGLHISSNSGHANIKLESTGRIWEILSTTGAYFSIYDTTGGTDRMAINSSGNVGIGTTNPGQKLDVVGTILAREGTTQTYGAALKSVNTNASAFVGWSNDNHHGIWFRSSVSADGSTTAGSDIMTFREYGEMQFWTGAGTMGQRMTIRSDGNVGIGTTTPSEKLRVNGTFSSNAFWTDASSISYWGSYSTAYGVMTWDTGYARVYATSGNRLDLGANGSNAHITIKTDGNVGIGNANPTAKLYVNGGMTSGYGSDSSFYTGTEFDSSKYFILQNNTDAYGRVGLAINAKTFSAAGTPSSNDGWALGSPRSGIRFNAYLSGDSDFATKFAIQHLLANAQSSYGDFGILAAGFSTTNPAFILTGAGNVGIGTSAPSAKLHIQGTSGDGTPTFRVTSTAAASAFNWAGSILNSSLGSSRNYILLIGQAESTKNSGYIGFNHSGTAGSNSNFLTFGLYGNDNLLNIKGDGNVGIGTTTPNAKLDVNGPISFNGDIRNSWGEWTMNVAQYPNNYGTSPDYFGGLSFNTTTRTLYISNKNNDGSVSDPNGAIVFRTGASPSDRVWITYGGNVGIGKNSPNAKLDVNGNTILSGSLIVNNDITSTNAVFSRTGILGGFYISQAGGTTDAWLFVSSNNLSILANTGKTVSINPNGSEIARFTSTGLSINKTSNANAMLDVNGNAIVSGSLTVGTGSAQGVSGEIRATNNITAYYSSDERLKTNIIKIDNALEKLKQIDGVLYDWNDTYKKQYGEEDGYFIRKQNSGIIAQQVEKVFPNVVADRQDGYKAVRYELLVPLLIEAIKEQNKNIENVKNELAELRKAINSK